ncbi:MAG: DNA methyltransferase [Candidatus Helarchaeota archaeon]
MNYTNQRLKIIYNYRSREDLEQKKQAIIDDRNKINDLTAKEWIISTKSVWTYSDYDMDKNLPQKLRYLKKLILFFTKKNDLIFSPSSNLNLNEISLKLKRRTTNNTKKKADLIIVQEDKKFEDFNCYTQFLKNDFKSNYSKFYNILKDRRYLCLISKNFYFNNSELTLFHYDINSLLSTIGFKLKGMIIWSPENVDSLTYLDNFNHKVIHYNILIFRKEQNIETGIDDEISILKSVELQNKTLYYRSFIESITPPRDKIKAQHPATFSEQDIKRLINFFTNSNPNAEQDIKVLDPFCGAGSTLLACSELNIEGWGIELTRKWIELTKNRFQKSKCPLEIHNTITYDKNLKFDKENKKVVQNLISGDSRKKILEFEDDFFDFIVTSPPYWGILTKKLDHKTKKERIGKGFEVKYTVKGKDKTFPEDLGNIQSYNQFLRELKMIFRGCFRKLKSLKYMVVIVSDFRDRAVYYLYHCDIANLLKEIGFKLTGLTVLHQNNKRLYPYGYPFDFVPNIHNQNIVIVKKEEF